MMKIKQIDNNLNLFIKPVSFRQFNCHIHTTILKQNGSIIQRKGIISRKSKKLKSSLTSQSTRQVRKRPQQQGKTNRERTNTHRGKTRTEWKPVQ